MRRERDAGEKRTLTETPASDIFGWIHIDFFDPIFVLRKLVREQLRHRTGISPLDKPGHVPPSQLSPAVSTSGKPPHQSVLPNARFHCAPSARLDGFVRVEPGRFVRRAEGRVCIDRHAASRQPVAHARVLVGRHRRVLDLSRRCRRLEPHAIRVHDGLRGAVDRLWRTDRVCVRRGYRGRGCRRAGLFISRRAGARVGRGGRPGRHSCGDCLRGDGGQTHPWITRGVAFPRALLRGLPLRDGAQLHRVADPPVRRKPRGHAIGLCEPRGHRKRRRTAAQARKRRLRGMGVARFTFSGQGAQRHRIGAQGACTRAVIEDRPAGHVQHAAARARRQRTDLRVPHCSHRCLRARPSSLAQSAACGACARRVRRSPRAARTVHRR